MYSEDFVCEVCVSKVELTVGTWCEVTDLTLVFEPSRGEPDLVNGGGGSCWGGVRVRGEHPVPAEEEEVVDGLGEDVSRGGTVVEEDHFKGREEGGGDETFSGPWVSIRRDGRGWPIRTKWTGGEVDTLTRTLRY